MSAIGDCSEPDRLYIDLGSANHAALPIGYQDNNIGDYKMMELQPPDEISNHGIFQPWQTTDETSSNLATVYQQNVNLSSLNYSVNNTVTSNYTANVGYSAADKEVSFYNSISGDHGYLPLPDHSRSSSVETTMSSLSDSSSYSHGSEKLGPVFGCETNVYSNSAITPYSSQVRKNLAKTTCDTLGKHDKKTYSRYPKPPYTYAGMIITAIENSPDKKLTLRGIHAKLSEMFIFFRGEYRGWKDSVRHNMSHNKFFHKAEIMTDICGKEIKNTYYWRVDLNKVYPDIFRRQDNTIGLSGLFKRFIHHQLELPPIELPLFPRQSNLLSDSYYEVSSYYNYVPTPEKFKGSRLKRKSVSSARSELARRYAAKETGNGTPQTVDIRNINMTLPDIDKCAIPTESPEQCHGRDRTFYKPQPIYSRETDYQSITPVKREHDIEIEHVPKRRRLSYSNLSTKTPDVSLLFDYVISGENNNSSALHALENLSMLCLSDTSYEHQATTGNYSPHTTEQKSYHVSTTPLNLDENITHKRRSSDFSIEGLIQSD